MPNIARWVWFPFGVTIRFLMKNGKRIAVSIVGVALVLAGLVMLVLPGPGILLVIAGLAVLATEYVWAQRMLNYAKRKGNEAKDRVLRRKPDVGGPG
ncbi:MAG TPA: PGPGW domain-containing protein [Actinomycetota bacterium]